ncbi:RUN domain-containing protein [Loa loa]|uniref:RUN domain-containing protein n=1 Tax=Loa loa TaxID=7209 RepID=A0A1I7VVE7_LOALO|nr:RUN domain-containing protein [Loa loa]EJD76375.1 RUN domain-containing protein [Loa loa]
MVELCELKLVDQNLESHWPADIDQHIAQLDFQRSTDDEDISLFSSMALDPSIISTDSLDIEKLHARCEVKKNDYKLTFEDSGQWTSGNFTTWGRIRSTEPLDEKTNSLPELSNNLKAATSEQQRPSSLVATFVERQPDYDYPDLYVGGGRYVDVNDNEIGFISQSSAAVQRADRWRAANRLPPNPPMKPRRTFADFQATRSPHLDFMVLNHNMPSLCQSSMSINEIMDKLKEGVLEDEKFDFSLFNVLEKRGPDSGLGSSATASSGPSHIEDWPSLALLLPKHVAEACSFFKANSQLLTGSNNIERIIPRRNETCRTCFNARKRLHPPVWAQPAKTRHVLYDCVMSEIVDRSSSAQDRFTSLGQLRLRAQELSIVGLPIYNAKRKLVEKVVEGVAEVARGGSSTNLCSTLEMLLADGLKIKHPWDMIVTVTAPGPATNNVYSLVNKLDKSEKPLNSRVETFFNELIKLGSVDCWMCYVVLKENVLARIYSDGAFMLRASTAYRSLLWRLLENLELITLLEHRPSSNFSIQEWPNTILLEASRLASDSRVPKSSSMPARLSNQKPNTYSDGSHTNSIHFVCSNNVQLLRRSRIPLLTQRPVRTKSNIEACSNRSSRSSSRDEATSAIATPLCQQLHSYGGIDAGCCLVSAIDDFNEPGMLEVSRGERLRILTTRGQLARCRRLRPRHDRVLQGLVPTSNLTVNGF